MRKKSTTITTNLLLLSCGLLLTGCDTSTLTAQLLSIEMLGVPESASGATGSEEPRYMIFHLNRVVLSEDESTQAVIFDGASLEPVRVVNRSQIIYSWDISDISGKTFIGATLGFDAVAQGVSLSNPDAVDVPLAEPQPTLSQSFKIEAGKGLLLTVKARWKNTGSEDGISSPELRLSIEAK